MINDKCGCALALGIVICHFPKSSLPLYGPGAFVVIVKLISNDLRGRSMKILVIEDESKVASFLRKGLEQSGYETDLAADGEEASTKIRGAAYDMVLLDLMLPKITGWDLIPLIRQCNPTAPILALTGRGSIEDRVRGLNLGCDDYLVKPFAFAELLARVDAQLRRVAALGLAELRVADLVLNPVRRKVTRAGKNIELSNKEFSLLEFLLRHKDQIVTREMIVENVWDSNYGKVTNVVDVYINYLRNKVDRGFEPRLIHTVRGAGYIIRS